jgi:beta-glucosidase
VSQLAFQCGAIADKLALFTADPTRFRNGTFCVRWEGVLTPDTTVQGGLFQLGLGKSRFNGKSPSGMGGRLWVDGNLTINATAANSDTTGSAYDFTAGKAVPIKYEYYQESTDGNPCTALLWSLLPSASSDSITPAVDEIAGADAVVVVVGGANNDQKGTTEGEGVDRASLTLAGEQMALVERAANASAAHSVPLVVVLVDGKPTAEPALKNLPGALLAAFQGGQAAGTGVASVIVGDYNPSGKLPVCFPASADVLPCYYNHKPSAARSGWIDATLPGGNGVLWQFGHGLSFSNFSYSDAVIPKNVSKNGTVKISVKVTNTGRLDGEEVAQLYLRDVISSVTQPKLALKGFERAMIKAGSSEVVTFTVDVASELKLLGRDFKWVVESGDWDVSIGGSSDGAVKMGTFAVA